LVGLLLCFFACNFPFLSLIVYLITRLHFFRFFLFLPSAYEIVALASANFALLFCPMFRLVLVFSSSLFLGLAIGPGIDSVLCLV
jgi:hypothetical protein